MLSYSAARSKVIATVSARAARPASETVPLLEALGRVLAEDIAADRDYPPFPRSTRDGFALRAADVRTPPAGLKRIGEIKAGEVFSGAVAAGECVEIMTGAPVPAGADAVAMLEYAQMKDGLVVIERSLEPGANIVPRGSEARAGARLLAAGAPIGFAEMSLLGQVGRARVPVCRRPRVAILSTGDEVVDVEATPGPAQIRNSNSASLAAQVRLCGCEAVLLGTARDDWGELKSLVARGLEADALLITGGVSMGKRDLVEAVLRDLAAEIFFDAVAIRPGRPAVFAACRGKFVFGLPGNPVSTMVTFELFVAPALGLLSGGAAPPLQFLKVRLAERVVQKTQLTLFLPARLEGQGSDVTVRALPWQGSGDVVALAQSNCFMVVPENVTELAADAWADVLPRRGPTP